MKLLRGKVIKLRNIIFAIFIFTMAFFIRIYNIGLLPINNDETHRARYLLENPAVIRRFMGIPIFYIQSFSHYISDFLVNYVSGSKIFTLGEFMFVVRFESVVIGAATVLLVYILAREMYGARTAIISSVFLCFLPWHIMQSRIAGRAIWVPFFGCLIFWCLFKAKQEKIKLWAVVWFLLACFFLKESLTTYESAILFVPIFFASLIWLGNEAKQLRSIKAVLIALLIAALFIGPFALKILKMGPDFWDIFCCGYQKNVFVGNLFFNLWGNIKNNFISALGDLFFNLRGSPLFNAMALRGPLLIHPVLFFLFIGSLIQSIYQRRACDKIILIWLLLGFFGGLAGVNLFQARYIIIALPVFIILTGKFIAEIFNWLPKRDSPKRWVFLAAVMLLTCGIITTEIVRWGRYYYAAPSDLDECLTNSYGSKEAGYYLSQIKDIESYNIFSDFRQATDVYLNFYSLNRGKGKIINYLYRFEKKAGSRGSFYVLWAAESHPKDFWDGQFQYVYDRFKQEHPGEIPVKTVYYPNGIPAIYIFKIDKG